MSLVTNPRLQPVILTARDAGRWDSFVREQGGSVLQSSGWAELKQQHGWRPLMLALTDPPAANDGGRIRAAALLLLRRVGPFSVAYIPRGPVVDWGDFGLVRQLFKQVHAVARRHRAIALTLEPNVAEAATMQQRLTALGFSPSPPLQPRNTIAVDISAKAEAVLAAMKPKTRYNIRLAAKRGVQVRQATTEADLDGFYALMQETASRDSFGIHALEYYRDCFRIFGPGGSGDCGLFLAHLPTEGDAPIAGLLAFALPPEGIYMYGASGERGRAAMPNHLLQWEAIQWCKGRSCTRYDMWGVPANIVAAEAAHAGDEEQNVRDGLWGVYRFKQGFGGQLYTFVGAWDYDYFAPLARLYRSRRPQELVACSRYFVHLQSTLRSLATMTEQPKQNPNIADQSTGPGAQASKATEAGNFQTMADLDFREPTTQADSSAAVAAPLASHQVAVMLKLAAPHGSERLLDIATEHGRAAAAFAPKVAEVIAVDRDPAAEAEVQQVAGGGHIYFQQAEADDLPFDAAEFDLVTIHRPLHKFGSDLLAVLKEARRVLRTPNGQLLVFDVVRRGEDNSNTRGVDASPVSEPSSGAGESDAAVASYTAEQLKTLLNDADLFAVAQEQLTRPGMPEEQSPDVMAFVILAKPRQNAGQNSNS